MTAEPTANAGTAGAPGQAGNKGTIRVAQLYPRDMNIYGDWGNALVLKRRISWHGYTPELIEYNVGDDFPEDVDIILGGGGQDSGQLVIQDDLLSRETVLKRFDRATICEPAWTALVNPMLGRA